jgi:hypothetical protein
MRRFGPFELDPMRRQLSRDSVPLHLTPKAFDLLKLLIDAAPRVVPKAELHARLWPETIVADATLVGLVKELRRALDDRDRSAPLIRTLHRVGYVFCPATQNAPARGSQVCGWLVSGDRRMAVVAGENVVGRDPASDVWLDFATVSRQHARIVAAAAAVRLQDLGSKNGTRVADRLVTEIVTLRNGDRIVFGNVSVIYRSPGTALATASQDISRAEVEPLD